ncbi:MAG TPA: hypothetical protein VNL77_05755 [Roseiflexaceae bacterium]|nr:hypothetical protein [Roseiflexaceae bacterium]
MPERNVRWNRSFETALSLVVAFITCLSALVTFRATIYTDEATNADFRGITAALAREEAIARTTMERYQQYRAYVNYRRNDQLGRLIWDDSTQVQDEAIAQALRNRATTLWDQNFVDDRFFDMRYLDANGQFDDQRMYDESMANERRSRDLDAEQHFRLADSRRTFAERQILLLIVLVFALWCCTLATEIKRRIRYPIAVAGVLSLALAIGGIVAIWLQA